MRWVFLLNIKNVIHYLKDFCTAFSANNTVAAASDATPVSMYFEIIWATLFHTNLLISVVSQKQHLVHLFPCFFFVVFFFRLLGQLTLSVWHIESRVSQLFLIPSLHPTPKGTFIPIPSAEVRAASAHCNISSHELRNYMALHCCKWFPLKDKDQRLLKQK